MAKETKDQIREKRGFKKEAPKCSTCKSYAKLQYATGRCTKDSFNVGGSAICNEYILKNV
jgi:hypothetical protein